MRTALAQLQANGPILLRDEALDLLFPVTDELHRHRLHPARRKPLAHLAPEQRTQLVAHDAIQHAPCLLCIHPVEIDRMRILHRCLDRRLRDLIEDDPAVIRSIQPQYVCQMPGNRFSLTIRIGCEIDLVGLPGFLLQFLNEIALAADVDIARREIMLHIDAELALWQIPQVPHRGTYDIILS